MKLLILSQYFPPEVGAPQNRLFELAVRLQKQGVEVTVLTAMPNYPKGEIQKDYIGKKYVFEKIDNLPVHRSSIYVTTSKGIAKRLLNYFSFVWSSYFVGVKKLETHYDFILCESPPLFLGITAFFLTKKKKANLIFNISDLWPESAEKLGLVTNKLFLKLATILEEFLYRKSVLITGQTQGIVKNIKTRFPHQDVYWLPNGVDPNFYIPQPKNMDWRRKNNFEENDLLLLYAGIIGYAQGLDTLLLAAKELEKYPQVKFLLLGSGPEKDRLLKLKENLNLSNVCFLDLVDKSKMPEIVNSIDLALVPLKKLDLFKGAIPSKIFENLAMEKPIILGVEGEAKELFVENGKCGLAYEPENFKDLSAKIISVLNKEIDVLQLGKNGREYVLHNFNRNLLAENLHRKLNSIL